MNIDAYLCRKTLGGLARMDKAIDLPIIVFLWIVVAFAGGCLLAAIAGLITNVIEWFK